MHIQAQRTHTSPFAAIPTTASEVSKPGASSPVAATSAASSSSSGDSSTTATATITANDFLQLLVTELQNQDPTADTDPNEYVDQLVQVNSLQQLIQINQNTTPSTTTTSDSSGKLQHFGVQAVSDPNPGSSSSTSSSASHIGMATRGNLSANLVNRPDFAAAAKQVASALAPGTEAAARNSSLSAPNGAVGIAGSGVQAGVP